MNKQVASLILRCACFLTAYTSFGANVRWNAFDVYDFGSWQQGAWMLGSGLPYAPGVGFFGNGDVWAEGSYNADDGGSYWVHSFWGDELSSFSDYEERQLLADVRYTGKSVVVGEGVSGGA